MERNSRIIFINSSVPVKYHSYRLLYNVHGSCMYIIVCTMNAVHLNNIRWKCYFWNICISEIVFKVLICLVWTLKNKFDWLNRVTHIRWDCKDNFKYDDTKVLLSIVPALYGLLNDLTKEEISWRESWMFWIRE